MNYLIKNPFIYLVAGLVSSLPLNGAYSVLSSIQDQLTALQEKVDQMEQQAVLGKKGAKLAGGLPNLDHPIGVMLGLEVVYFKTQLGGTAFSYANSSAYTDGLPPIEASLQELNFDMDFGIGACIERQFSEQDCALKLEYLHYRTTGSQSRSSNIADSQVPLKGINVIGEGVNSAKSIGKVEWNDLALNFHKSFFITDHFLMQPTVGIKSSWIMIKQWSQYTGGSFLSVNTDHVYDKSQFFGIGPDLGGKAEWFFGKNFSLSGIMDVGLEYGFYRVKYKEEQSNLSDHTFVLKQTKHQFSPVFDFAIDINYGFFANSNKVYGKVSLGYEAIFFLKQNQSLQLFSEVNRIQNISEDLSFHGITGKLGFYF
jgi:hypothetical protein